jgi:hypothetical protein
MKKKSGVINPVNVIAMDITSPTGGEQPLGANTRREVHRKKSINTDLVFNHITVRFFKFMGIAARDNNKTLLHLFIAELRYFRTDLFR